MQHFVEDSAAYIANFGFISLALLFIELLDYANLTQKKNILRKQWRFNSVDFIA